LPLFSKEEARKVIATAESEGVDKNEYKSGKYKLGGDWLTKLPKTREWFNSKLEDTFFPLLSHLFPEVVSSPSVLRAHSVSMLKYNSSHPRTDVHIDNGVLAMTLAMTPSDEYVGGGTFFEHFDTVLPMDVGHGTFRPGSVRHGGHPVSDGTRYILGAFLLIEDQVEHVRRLKNRGSDLRRAGDLEAAERHFQWALALNPKCTTCLKDWAEILLSKKDFMTAEEKIRSALELLEEKDSDALFSLGQILSAQGRDEESIDAYMNSVKLNAEDAELLYNLAIKLGARGDKKEENKMYAKATQVDPKFGGAWLNWGTNLAEQGLFDDAELMFLKTLECGPEVLPKAMINLALIRHTQASFKMEQRDLEGAMESALDASQYLDAAKPLLDGLVEGGDAEAAQFLGQFRPLRLQCHRNMAQLYAGAGEMASSESELRAAVKSFPKEPMAWQMLGRILEMQGKVDEVAGVQEKLAELLCS
jgi:tetratricopeptide (TPR) repeat protein